MNKLYKEKLKSFITYTIIFGLLSSGSFVIGKYLKPEIPFGVIYNWGTICVFGSMGFGVIIPIVLRLVFHNNAIKNTKVTVGDYRKHQKLQVEITFLGTVFIIPALLFDIPMVHLYVTVLAVLYGIYSVIPSMKKIIGETNLYNINIKRG